MTVITSRGGKKQKTAAVLGVVSQYSALATLPQGRMAQIPSKCGCGFTRLIEVAEIQSLAVWREELASLVKEKVSAKVVAAAKAKSWPPKRDGSSGTLNT